MGLDINLFRIDKGNDPEKIKDVQRNRFKKQEDIDRVDLIVQIDKDWRSVDFQVNQLNRDINKIQKEIGLKMKNKESAEELLAEKNTLTQKQEDLDVQRKELLQKLQVELRQIGNLLHPDVVISSDEANNKIIRTWGEIPPLKITQKPGACYHH